MTTKEVAATVERVERLEPPEPEGIIALYNMTGTADGWLTCGVFRSDSEHDAWRLNCQIHKWPSRLVRIGPTPAPSALTSEEREALLVISDGAASYLDCTDFSGSEEDREEAREMREAIEIVYWLLSRHPQPEPPSAENIIPREAMVEVCNAADAHSDRLRVEANETNSTEHRTNAFKLAQTYRDCAQEVRAWMVNGSPAPSAAVALPDLASAGKELHSLIVRAQEILSSFLCPDGIDGHTALNKLLELLDGPAQREIEAKWSAALSQRPASADEKIKVRDEHIDALKAELAAAKGERKVPVEAMRNFMRWWDASDDTVSDAVLSDAAKEFRRWLVGERGEG